MDITGLDKWHFELTESACNELLGLVLEGKKKATSSSVYSFRTQGHDIPKEGDLSVITDWGGNPKCVIRTSKVHVLPYRDITFDLARLEGEDDSLESWRKSHLYPSFSDNSEAIEPLHRQVLTENHSLRAHQ